MTGQITTTALLVEYLQANSGEWFTRAEVEEDTRLSDSTIHRDLDSMVQIDVIDVREREEPNTAGPNPYEYRFVA